MKNLLLPFAIAILLIGAGCGSTTSSTNSTSSTTTNRSGQTVTLTTSEVAQHTSSNDCWMIISGSVYNVTSYLPQHPGGSQEMTPYCGQDATTAFATQGGRGSHSGMAQSDLASLLLGALNTNVTL
jgi:cytochrome b involved in lipid metabolism